METLFPISKPSMDLLTPHCSALGTLSHLQRYAEVHAECKQAMFYRGLQHSYILLTMVEGWTVGTEGCQNI